jgi:hypothetical protein
VPPGTGFVAFCADHDDDIDLEDLSDSAKAKELGRRWVRLSPTDKAPYVSASVKKIGPEKKPKKRRKKSVTDD